MENFLSLEGKNALVTGGAQGIGFAISKRLAEAGAHVIIIDLFADKAEEAAAEIKKSGGSASTGVCNVADSEAVNQMVKDQVKEYSTIDILVNNAGITKDNLMMRMSDDQWDAVININLKGTFNCIRAITKPMMKQRSGVIINIASVIGLMGNAGQANYAASKAGVIGLTKSVAKELAPRGIRCNAIAPGFIRSAMTDLLSEDVQEGYINAIPLKRYGEPEDVANTVLFMSADMGSYVTGQVLSVCGGLVI